MSATQEPVDSFYSALSNHLCISLLHLDILPALCCRRFGIGAIAEGGHTILNEHAVRLVGATPDQLNSIRQQEDQELQRRKSVYRGGKECLPVTGER